MFCPAFAAGRCASCTLLDSPYDEQLAGKAARAAALLAPFGDVAWEPPVASREAGYRNKAKLVVGGTVDAPTLGILDADHRGVDLQDCLLYEPALAASFPSLAAFVTRAGLVPYAVPERTGELKHLIVTVSPGGELMVRFVLRSTEALARIRKHLPSLLADLPNVAVASVNVLPAHAAVLEGEREIPLTAAEALRMTLNGVDLWLRPQGFFQTNSAIAARLYREAASWLSDDPAGSLWDLYCGVGGFALHASTAEVSRVLGVETSEAAVAGARLSAEAAGADVRFVAGDATAFAVGSSAADLPDVVVVNPPRRGIGTGLAAWLESSGVPRVLYSSCNVDSLAADLAEMPSLRPVRGRVLDMFPQTPHGEVLVELRRSA